MTASATWGNFNLPYVVLGTITVGSGATLTILPGQVIKLDGTYTQFIIRGTLIADGTDAAIYFTSLRDDTVGGDTNGDGAGSAPGRGNWAGVYFANTSTNSVLKNVVIRYGGREVIRLRISILRALR